MLSFLNGHVALLSSTENVSLWNHQKEKLSISVADLWLTRVAGCSEARLAALCVLAELFSLLYLLSHPLYWFILHPTPEVLSSSKMLLLCSSLKSPVL